ncbi:SDR family oxidoreductase [Pelodictyon luteolum]|uniref:Sepiapterin reductase n=1 Tax=Chlorobium luteolum (strain DSM 273 / BCRC 81028 / 2530) TaxID=319225 RepID=Q3B5A2_CHLL3|nr:SDR family oxidoreductase [Pelodictyon luteolum]ABB23479.1 sepiapterin reductase [Pelodictyon luteolum DSM 273]
MQHIIIITGAGKGIGRAIALDFAYAHQRNPEFNPMLILVSRTAADLEPLAVLCRNAGAEAETAVVDIADIAALEGLVESVMERHGRIDCLVNNAGVGTFKPIGEITEKEYDRMAAVNMKGTFFLTQKVFRHMQCQRSGHLFFITSVAAEKAFPSSSVYSMTKFAQKGLVESVRLYARTCGVRVTNVMPGAVLTPMWGEVDDAMREVMMMPEDISGPVVDAYLLPARTVVEELVFRPVAGDINE